MTKWIFTTPLACLVLLLATTTGAEAKKLYRWVDENGDVHYSESLPPGFEDEGHDVLDRQGLVREENQKLTPEYKEPKRAPKKEELPELPRDASGNQRPRQLYSDTETQQRMDAFLLLRYETEAEITDAMNIEIRQLEYDKRILVTTQDSLNKSYRQRIQVAANKQRAGQKVEDGAIQELQSISNRLARNQQSLDLIAKRETEIRSEFSQEIERYRRLEAEQAAAEAAARAEQGTGS